MFRTVSKLINTSKKILTCIIIGWRKNLSCQWKIHDEFRQSMISILQCLYKFKLTHYEYTHHISLSCRFPLRKLALKDLYVQQKTNDRTFERYIDQYIKPMIKKSTSWKKSSFFYFFQTIYRRLIKPCNLIRIWRQ